jgi:hypothetical protein
MMKKLLFLLVSISLLYSCEREEDKVRELDITLKSTSSIVNSNNENVDIYPNPFQNSLFLNYSGSNKAEIYIHSFEGAGKKFIIEDANSVQFNFSNEKTGTYKIEVLVNGIIFREYAIKER